MTKEDIIRMAREVGLPHWYETEGIVNEALLIKFAALVASAEHKRVQQVYTDAATDSVKAAIAYEREACAKECEGINSAEDYYGERPELVCADAIRARGEASIRGQA